MARRLEGKRVAITGPRRAEELSKLVENMGGIPLLRPAQGTVLVDDQELRSGLATWMEQPPDWAIFTTGVGLTALLDLATEMGQAEAWLEVLRSGSIAARGYKTVNVLKKNGLSPVVRDDDGSSEGLIRSFEAGGHSLAGKEVILQLYGDTAPKLSAWLEAQGARFRQLLPYQHIAPPAEQLEQLLSDLTEGRADAVTFTSAPQVRFLLEHASAQGKLEQLMEAFRGPVVAVAVGKVTAHGLYEAGVPRVVAPQEERMGSMMVELARYYAGEAKALVES